MDMNTTQMLKETFKVPWPVWHPQPFGVSQIMQVKFFLLLEIFFIFC
jgi:hypothetical protein